MPTTYIKTRKAGPGINIIELFFYYKDEGGF